MHAHLQIDTELEQLLRYLTYQTSAVLQGVKPAELITLKESGCGCVTVWKKHKREILTALRLECAVLREKENSVSLLFFRQALLSHRLQALRGHPLLQAHGYLENPCFSAAMRCLKQRFTEEPVPHEIGLFLGYPERDVEAFAAGRLDHCMCRYWKVYHDPEEASRLMRQIDDARQFALALLEQHEACYALEALHRSIA